MIQRIQTVFLLAIAILSALLIFLPFEEVVIGGQSLALCLMPGCLPGMAKWFIYIPMALNVIILILSLFTVFMYKNRRRQMKLASLLLVLSALLIGNLFTFHFIEGQTSNDVVNYKVASFFPILNSIFAFLARHFIKKDEDLVRSADRIR